MKIITTPQTFQTTYVVYLITIDNLPAFVGTSQFVTLPMLTDAKLNTEWKRLVRNTDIISIELIASGLRAECEAIAANMIITHQPFMNVKGEQTAPAGRSGSPIRCVETGVTFESSKDAAASAGVTRSAMSQHLSGDLRHIGGMHYERVEQ